MHIKRGVMGYPTIPLADTQKAWEKALTSLKPGKKSLYIHIPFCRTHCPFCPFHLGKISQSEFDEYVKLLIKEIKTTAESDKLKESHFNTVYFGGGTPTDLKAQQIEKILKTIFKHFKLSNDCEITIEGRINGFSDDKISAAANNGVNRFSIGVQSFNTKLRQSIGRLDSREKIISTLNHLNSYNHASIVIDLLYGIPGQTLDDWINDLKTALLETPISGLDLYRLNIYEDLKIHEMIKQGNLPRPDEETLFEMYKTASQIMDEFGAARLSIHHYAINYRERNAHNELGSQKATCIQFGMKAGGRIGNFFFRQTTDLCEYRNMVSSGQKPISYAGKLPNDFQVCSELNHQIIKYRCIDLHKIAQKDKANSDKIISALQPELEKMKADGLLCETSFGLLKLSDKAMFNFKKIISELMEIIAKTYSSTEKL